MPLNTSPVGRAVAASCRRPWLVVALMAAITLCAIGYASRHFAMTTDTAALIAPTVDWRRNELAVDTAFPQQRDVTVIVIDGATPELAEAGAAGLSARLAADRQHFHSVRRPDGGAFFDREGLLFGSVDEVRATTAQLIDAQPLLGPLAADPSLRGVMTALATMITGVARGDATLARIDRPMRALDTALASAAEGKPAYFSWQALFADKPGGLVPPRRRLILVQPVLDYRDLTPGATAGDAIRAAAAALRLDPAHGVQVRLTGAVPLADEEFASLADRAWLVGGAMLAAMLLTLWFATRSWRVVAAIMLTTLAGLAATAALGLAAIGRFNLISVAFIPLFVGLGIDFGIQIGVRFRAERMTSADPAEALIRAATALGTPLMVAATAVCLGFFAFLPTDYVGISELGVIAGLGMIVALLFSITLLPALLILLRTDRPAQDMGFARLAPLDRLLLRKRRAVLWAFALAMAGSIALLPLVRFDFNPLDLRDPDGEAMATLQDLTRDPDRTPNTVDVLAANPAAAQPIAARLAALPEVARALTIDSFVPADQPAKLALIGDARGLLELSLDPFDIAAAPDDAANVASLTATAAALRGVAAGSDAPAATARRLAQTLDRLAAGPADRRGSAERMLVQPLAVMLDQSRALLQAEPLTRAGLPPDVRRDWIAGDGRARIQLFPKANDNDGLSRFTAAVRGVAPGAAGLPISTQEAAHTVARAFIAAGLIALVTVSLLLFAVLRSLGEVAFTLAPVVLSGFLTLASCVLIGQSINFANIIAFPLLFGVGTAFHIYFVMAWRGGATDLLQSSLARAVLFSALATGSAFGSLWLSSHPGTASMGKILMISLAWTLVCALIFEPALLGPARGRREGDGAAP